MKKLIALSTVISLSATAFTPSKKAFPEAKKASADSLDQLREKQSRLNSFIGMYPPQINDKSHEQELYSEWSQIYSDLLNLTKESSNSEDSLALFADLYRQGHNLHIEGAGIKSVETLEKCLKSFPESYGCHKVGIYLYLQIHPKYADRAKKSLDFLKKHYAPKLDEDIEAGYIFYYLFTKNNLKALEASKSFLKNFPDSGRSKQISMLLSALQNSKAGVATSD